MTKNFNDKFLVTNDLFSTSDGRLKGMGSKKNIDDLINEFWYFTLLVIIICNFLGSIFYLDVE